MIVPCSSNRNAFSLAPEVVPVFDEGGLSWLELHGAQASFPQTSVEHGPGSDECVGRVQRLLNREGEIRLQSVIPLLTREDPGLLQPFHPLFREIIQNRRLFPLASLIHLSGNAAGSSEPTNGGEIVDLFFIPGNPGSLHHGAWTSAIASEMQLKMLFHRLGQKL